MVIIFLTRYIIVKKDWINQHSKNVNFKIVNFNYSRTVLADLVFLEMPHK